MKHYFTKIISSFLVSLLLFSPVLANHSKTHAKIITQLTLYKSAGCMACHAMNPSHNKKMLNSNPSLSSDIAVFLSD